MDMLGAREKRIMPIKRIYLYLALAVVVVLAGAGLKYFENQKRIASGQVPGAQVKTVKPAIGGAFTLTDHNGNRVKDTSFHGKYTLMFFGYTYCPDVCPTTLTTVSEALDLMGDDAKKIQPLFITVDPDRDKPEDLKSYLEHFHSSFVGLTGTRPEIDKITKSFRIYAAKAQENKEDPEDYLMDHSAVSYMMRPDGSFETFFSHGMTAESIAIKIKDHL